MAISGMLPDDSSLQRELMSDILIQRNEDGSWSRRVGRISEFDFCRDMFAMLTDALGLRNLDLQSSRKNEGKTHDYIGTVES